MKESFDEYMRKIGTIGAEKEDDEKGKTVQMRIDEPHHLNSISRPEDFELRFRRLTEKNFLFIGGHIKDKVNLNV